MPQAFGVTTLTEEVVRVASGKETVVQSRNDSSSTVHVSASSKVFGFLVSTNNLLEDWHGGGTFVMRIWRGSQKIAEGRFTLSSA
jgi:hypothetical protein